jgi:hypothetical protein
LQYRNLAVISYTDEQKEIKLGRGDGTGNKQHGEFKLCTS